MHHPGWRQVKSDMYDSVHYNALKPFTFLSGKFNYTRAYIIDFQRLNYFGTIDEHQYDGVCKPGGKL